MGQGRLRGNLSLMLPAPIRQQEERVPEVFRPPRGLRAALVGFFVFSAALQVGVRLWLLLTAPLEVRQYLVGPFGLSLLERTILLAPLSFAPSVVAYFAFRSIRIVLTNESVTISRFWKLHFSDVARAERRRMLGFDYVAVLRKGGAFRWWIPLDYVSTRPLRTALADAVPAGNPVREALTALPNQRLI